MKNKIIKNLLILILLVSVFFTFDFFIKNNQEKELFKEDIISSKKTIIYPVASVSNYSKIIKADVNLNKKKKAIEFANEINNNVVANFEKENVDQMVHVSTFIYANNNIYMTYYANPFSNLENPNYHVARLAYIKEDNPSEKIILDIMAVGDNLKEYKVEGVYDTILMKKDNDDTNLYILWTAKINGKYYRLYRLFNMKTEKLSEVFVNKFKVGKIINDFSTSGIMNALSYNNIGYKRLYSDIGIMQKISTRIENGVKYYYTGAYSGDFTCIIKSKDLITWEYVAQPNEGANGTGFDNATKWENAVYVLDDKVYYYVRQHKPSSNQQFGSYYGILTYYDLKTKEWETPVLVEDCQSRSDFIFYNNKLYLFYAPTDREHIGILEINTKKLKDTKVILQADMKGSVFYPFVQYNTNNELSMSYTVNRKHIKLSNFTLSKYLK